MASGRPIHELLADLVGDADAARAHGDPEAYLAANGHADLPPDLVAEAVVSYADTAPVDVAEHLSPYVMTHSAVPSDEPPAEDWFGLITTAPTEDLDAPAELDDDLPDDSSDDLPDDSSPAEHQGDPTSGLDFGAGSDPGTAFDAKDDASEPAGSLGEPADDAAGREEAAWTDLEPENVDLDAIPDEEEPDLDELD